MTDKIVFTLDGKQVAANAGETIWDVAKREGTKIPHLCHVDLPGYRVDGNCRACMVEIKGERVLTASCIRKPTAGMDVQTQSKRAVKSREMVFELLASNMRPREAGPDNQAPFWEWASSMGIAGSKRYASKFAGEHETAELDLSNPAIAVNLDACISCGACVRACREVQVNDVIGMGLRGSHSVPVFDIRDPMGHLDVRHVRRVRPGVPDRRAVREIVDGQDGDEARRAEVRQGRQHAVSVLRRRLPDGGGRQRQPHRAGRRPQRLREREPALRQRPLRLRLCGLAGAHHEAARSAATTRRRRRGHREAVRGSLRRVPRSDLGRSADARRQGPQEDPRRARRQSAVGLRLGEGVERRGVPVPEARAHGLRDQQRRSLHAALPRLVRRRAHGRDRLGRRVGAVQRRDGCRMHHRHRCAPDREPSGCGHLLQASREARREADRHRSARPGLDAPRGAWLAVQARQRCRTAELVSPHDHRGEAVRRNLHPRARLRLRGAEGEGEGLLAGSDGGGRRHRGERAARRCAHLRDFESVDHLLGHGHLAAHARHRQRALLDRACVDHGPDRPAGNRVCIRCAARTTCRALPTRD